MPLPPWLRADLQMKWGSGKNGAPELRESRKLANKAWWRWYGGQWAQAMPQQVQQPSVPQMQQAVLQVQQPEVQPALGQRGRSVVRQGIV
jgi:hypothetical protein